MRERKWGFSLLECVIAVTVLSIGVLGVMSAMSFSVTQQEHAELVPVAAYYAQQIMEDIKINRRHVSVPAPGLPAAGSGLNSATQVAIDAAPFDTLFNRIKDTNGDNIITPAENTALNLTRYTRSIEMVRGHASAVNYKHQLVRVTINVFWRETTGTDQRNPGNTVANTNSGGKTAVQRRFELQAVLD